MTREEHPAESALLDEPAGHRSSRWPELLDNFVQSQLAPELLRATRGSGIGWPDEKRAASRGEDSERRAPVRSDPNDYFDQSGLKREFMDEELARITERLMLEGVNPLFDRRLLPLARYLTRFTRQHALDYLRKLGPWPPADLEAAENTEAPESSESTVPSLQLVDNLNAATDPSACAGIQLLKRLDWNSEPARKLNEYLKKEVLSGEPAAAWKRLNDLHAAAEAEQRERSADYTRRLERARGGATYRAIAAEWEHRAIRHIFHPLEAAAIKPLTAWAEYTYKVLSRYTEKLCAGEIVAIPDEKLPLIQPAFAHQLKGKSKAKAS